MCTMQDWKPGRKCLHDTAAVASAGNAARGSSNSGQPRPATTGGSQASAQPQTSDRDEHNRRQAASFDEAAEYFEEQPAPEVLQVEFANLPEWVKIRVGFSWLFRSRQGNCSVSGDRLVYGRIGGIAEVEGQGSRGRRSP